MHTTVAMHITSSSMYAYDVVLLHYAVTGKTSHLQHSEAIAEQLDNEVENSVDIVRFSGAPYSPHAPAAAMADGHLPFLSVVIVCFLRGGCSKAAVPPRRPRIPPPALPARPFRACRRLPIRAQIRTLGRPHRPRPPRPSSS